MVKVTVEVPREEIIPLAAILDMYARERRTPSGAISRSGKGEFTYVESFREVLASLAGQLREGVE